MNHSPHADPEPQHQPPPVGPPPSLSAPLSKHPMTHFPQNNNLMNSRAALHSYLPVVEEPICVLKIELDGEHIEEIKVFENDDPSEIVQKFGNDFNLS